MYYEPKIKEECGIFGIFGRKNASQLTYFGLHALQHRGQESAGIVVSEDGDFSIHKGMGLVSSVFGENNLRKLKGDRAIGHVRYSTTGSSLLSNAQPLLINSGKGMLALAHNGNLVNGYKIRRQLEKEGSIFHTTLDTEVIAHLIARSREKNIEDSILDCLKQIKGAFSLVLLTKDNLYGIRDPYGFRPLSLGKLGDGYVLASETCALDIVGAEYVRDIKPGEMVIINSQGVCSIQYAEGHSAFCIFEFIYFARPDSIIGGQNVHLARMEMGRALAREMSAEIDVVVPVPDSGISAAQGFAEEKGIPFQWGLIKNRYVGRTFISPEPEIRDIKVKLKLNPICEIIKGKRVLLIDDSIVRGTTSKRIIKMLKEKGAKEVHFGVSSPPVVYPCYYGLDTSNRRELIAARMSVEEICNYIGADSLTYLSQAGMLKALARTELGFCTACFDGNYPIGKGTGKYSLEEGRKCCGV
ncbi:amidophosphoribosyltransferase [Anoxybacter fermentans]|uniref:Amidophosphoribosyltransferase n=1 Tax=Anoxybacter fermentans TaxID=1323375 RepID=A0A3Q9HRQ6_9FIRM|nr:amidophosphoribosyltransferase [Anoxybacter fermentans]AZR74232.1 amidophosphoribosyltransferase [Anoxybacter fermentans]